MLHSNISNNRHKGQAARIKANIDMVRMVLEANSEMTPRLNTLP